MTIKNQKMLNKNLKEKLEKYKTIISIYFTPKNQMWCILNNGKKKCILKKIVDNIELHNFVSIYYSNSWVIVT